MAVPRVLILRAPGTNCDLETAHAFELAGARTERIHVNRLFESPQLFEDFQILCFPGGFSYGDDIAAGRVLATRLHKRLAEPLAAFKDAGKLVLGICNGFQVLIQTGLLLAEDEQGRPATLTWNERGRFEDRWVHLEVAGERCVFLEGIERMYLPIAHAEGRFLTRSPQVLQQLAEQGRLVLRYAAPHEEPVCVGPAASALPITMRPAALPEPLPFPHNPNGAQGNVAGLCDETGRVLGLMPHPERHIDPTHHPRWTRGEAGEVGDGLALFQNAVRFFA